VRIVFLGSGDFGVPTLLALLQTEHDVCLVVSQPDRPAGRKKVLTPAPIAREARRAGLPLFQPEFLKESGAQDRIAQAGPDVLVVVDYGQILRPPVLEIPRLGCINVHGSLLPRHRGASPIQAAILAGDEHSGVTIMQMDEGLDSGPVLAATSTQLDPRENAGELHERLAKLAPKLLLSVLADLQAGRGQAYAQDSTRVTTCGLITKQHGRLRWEDPARDLDRRVRAMTPWPGAFGLLDLPRGELRLIIEQAEALDQPTGAAGRVLEAGGERLVVAAGQGSLRLLQVRPAGRRSLTIAPFLRGYPVEVGVGMQTVP